MELTLTQKETLNQIFNKLIEKDLNDNNPKFLRLLKTICIENQFYHESSVLLNIEREIFPNLQSEQNIIEESEKLSKLIGLHGVEVSPKYAHLFNEIFKKYSELGFDYTIKDASEIQTQNEKIFNK